MKKLIMFLLLTVSLTAWSQEKKFDFKKFAEQVENKICEKAGFTEEEKAVFLPIYREFACKRMELQRNVRKLRSSQCAQQDYRKCLLESFRMEKEISELQYNYVEKALEVLPAEKIYKVVSAAEEMRRGVIKNHPGRK